MKRYWLMKLKKYDKKSKLEVWKYLNTASESPHILNNFLANGFRIWDEDEHRVIKTNLDVSEWIKKNPQSERNESMAQKITNLMIHTSYEYAKKVYNCEVELGDALDKIVIASGMYRGSALAYISDFRLMLEGREYKRTMSQNATRFYLENIGNDYGIECLETAIKAVLLHINYYERVKGSKLKSLVKVIDDVKELFNLN
ncbi:hypothetical protein [Paenibacillus polymyxa]|uniref:hypothetical protein n=1 Tax=Paenibacillus polymyxa TaxID=1406 RepID=UPI002AB516BC|nr:hypothetical protein [Paenibacillus polymyxa]MDY8021185.1 hypothetical protein [Paenibacillus polymyxa]